MEIESWEAGVRWLGAAPGAAGENFLIHGLKKIEGCEGANLDENTYKLVGLGPVSKSRI